MKATSIASTLEPLRANFPIELFSADFATLREPWQSASLQRTARIFMRTKSLLNLMLLARRVQIEIDWVNDLVFVAFNQIICARAFVAVLENWFHSEKVKTDRKNNFSLSAERPVPTNFKLLCMSTDDRLHSVYDRFYFCPKRFFFLASGHRAISRIIFPNVFTVTTPRESGSVVMSYW